MYIYPSTDLQWLAPLSHKKEGSLFKTLGGLSMWSLHVLLRVSVVFLQILWLPPTLHRHAFVKSKWSHDVNVSE